jgi:hypothetical protein
MPGGRPPTLIPMATLDSLILYCFAKEIKKQYPELRPCTGCRYSHLSQRNHIGCNTITNQLILGKENFVVDRVPLALNILLLNRKCGVQMPADDQIDAVIFKCNNQWKYNVIHAIAYDFGDFPEAWGLYI